MAMERSASTARQMDLLDLEKVLQLLTYKIANIENAILIRHKLDKHKPLDDLAWRYQNELVNLTNELTSISRRLFQNTSIAHVKPYKNEDDIPQGYRAYLYAAQNVVDLVCYDILSQLDVNLAVIVMERWVWLLKHSFEINDFFVASSIINALRRASILKLDIEDKLSQTGWAILCYFEELLPNQAAVYQLQKGMFENGEEVIPMLSTLAKMMDGIEQQPIEESESKKIETYCFIKKKKSRINLDFIDMQKRLQAVLSPNTLEIISLLSGIPEKNEWKTLGNYQRKLEIDMSKLVAQINLYLPVDDYYEYHKKLKSFPDKLNRMANEFKAKKDASKGELLARKCMGIKNILLDNESDLEVKLTNIGQMKSDPVCKASKKLSAVLSDIANVMMSLIDVLERKKWQGSPRNRRTASGGELKNAGFFAEKQYDSPPMNEKSSPEEIRHAKS